MHILVDEVLATLQQFSSKHHSGCGTIVAVLLLSFRHFDNHLGSRMLNVHFLENRCSIVGDDDITHAIDEHLVHALWAKRGPNRISNCFRSRNIVALCSLSTGSIRAFFQNENWLLSAIHLVSPTPVRSLERGCRPTSPS